MSEASSRSGARRLAAMIAAVPLLLGSAAFAQHYQQTDLIANSTAVSSTATIDPNLVNAWGMSRSSGSFWWVSDNGTGLTTLYNGAGGIGPLVVTIPTAKGGTPPSAPTGTVYNYTTSFEVAAGAPSLFLFVSENGTISGWNPGVDVNNAVVKVDRSKDGASFKGCAIAMTHSGPRLYVSNFTTGRVEVYDGNFKRLLDEKAFQDSNLPANFVPFGIQNVGGNIVVTFARRAPGEEDEDHGNGLGYVTVFDTRGRIVLRLQHGSFLNAPWGIALAPGDFGPFSHRLLIGNFGDGRIHAFNAVSGAFEGTMLDANGAPLSIDGLWGLSFGGNSTNGGSATELFFTAGPGDESNGLLGKLTATGSEQRGNSE